MTTNEALHLALAILEPFAEAGNIYDDYKADEGFTDEQYTEMVAVLKALMTTAKPIRRTT